MLESQIPSRRSPHAWLPLGLMLAALVLRVLRQHHIFEGTGNLSPLMAFAFTGSVVFPRSFPWWSWLVILLGVDWASEGSSWWASTNGRPEVLLTYGCYAAAALWGSSLRGRAGIADTLARSVACSVVFYLVTNTLSWFTAPYYTKDIAGWTQAMTTGKPDEALTTLAFFRNSLVADTIGSLVLLVAYNAEAVLRSLAALPLWQGSRRQAVTA